MKLYRNNGHDLWLSCVCGEDLEYKYRDSGEDDSGRSWTDYTVSPCPKCTKEFEEAFFKVQEQLKRAEDFLTDKQLMQVFGDKE